MSYNTGMDWQIYGHDWAVKLLQTHAGGEKLRHAYLFAGPEGVGRRTLALRFAQALNCSAPPAPGAFCGTCRNCQQIQSMRHPDLDLVVPEEGHQDVLIDQIRELQHRLALAPYAAAYRIALLPDVQHVTEQAQNALLKTLEEPPDKVVLLLTVNALESLLPTIVSRCEVLRMRSASVTSTQAYLQSTRALTQENAVLIAHLSGGRIGAAIQLAEGPGALLRRQEVLESFFELFPAKYYERFKAAEELASPYAMARQKVSEVLPVWLSFWRDVFIRSSGSKLPIINVDLGTQVDYAAGILDMATARQLVLAHETALKQIALNANIRLVVETLMLHLPVLSPPEMV